MSTAFPKGSAKRQATPDVPYYVVHESFEQTGAIHLFGPTRDDDDQFSATYMPDDVTRDLARCMHYAAWRLSRTADYRRRAHWKREYLAFRDRIVLGNRKLIYRAVRRWMPAAAWVDDMTGDCQIVLIQAVAAYNPWLGIRFSTYAFTCLMRAFRGCRSGTRRTDCPSRCPWNRCRTGSRAIGPAWSILLPICRTSTSICVQATGCCLRAKRKC